jgi:protocatechuate 3,4-dioxygenase beta subunit
MADPSRLSRRLLLAGLGVGALAGPAMAQRRREAGLNYAAPETLPDYGLDLSPTPACDDGEAEATIRQTEGPYYSPDTPRRDDLAGDGEGRALVIVGRVLSTGCRPLPGAVLDFWHADSNGVYDNDGYRFRGHQFADASGAFRLTTIRPAGYGYASAARPPHVHVKVQGAGTALLTTQLYFPDEDNSRDRIFRDALVMNVTEESGVLIARYDLVLAA